MTTNSLLEPSAGVEVAPKALAEGHVELDAEVQQEEEEELPAGYPRPCGLEGARPELSEERPAISEESVTAGAYAVQVRPPLPDAEDEHGLTSCLESKPGEVAGFLVEVEAEVEVVSTSEAQVPTDVAAQSAWPVFNSSAASPPATESEAEPSSSLASPAAPGAVARPPAKPEGDTAAAAIGGDIASLQLGSPTAGDVPSHVLRIRAPASEEGGAQASSLHVARSELREVHCESHGDEVAAMAADGALPRTVCQPHGDVVVATGGDALAANSGPTAVGDAPPAAPLIAAPASADGGEEASLPPIAEDDLLDLACDSHRGTKPVNDTPKEASSRRSNSHAVVAAAARSRHPRRPAEELELSLRGAPEELSLYILHQVDRLARRLDSLERNTLPPMQRSAFEALSMARSQESRLKNWTESAASAINFLGEESSVRRQEVQDLHAIIAKAVASGGLGAQAPVQVPATADAASGPESPRSGPVAASSKPRGPFSQTEVDRFASACQAAAAQATAAEVAGFEKQLAAERASLEKEFQHQREEVLRMMEALSKQAALLAESWEELTAIQLAEHGVAEEGRAGSLKCSSDASPSKCSHVISLGDEMPVVDDECSSADPSLEEVHGMAAQQELKGFLHDMAAVEKSASLRDVLMKEVSQVRLELQAATGQGVRGRRSKAAPPSLMAGPQEAKSPDLGWSFWMKGLGCNAEAVSAGKPASTENPVLVEHGLWDQLLGGSGSHPVVKEDSRPNAEGETLRGHAAL